MRSALAPQSRRTLALACVAFACAGAAAAAPVLRLSGEARVRYESLEGQFRAEGRGGDQLLSLRTLILGEVDAGPLTFGAELQDARAYLGDDGTPYGTSLVNAADLLQAYIRVEGARGELKLGRQTLALGSERQVERTDFGNVITAFTGASGHIAHAGGARTHAFLVAPVAIRPDDRPGLADNTVQADRASWGRRFFAVHHVAPDLLGTRWPGLQGEAYLYGLHESDAHGPTANRRYLTPGLRLVREPAEGRWDVDVEVAGRFGERRASDNPADRRDLKVRAGYAHIAVGRSLSGPARPRLELNLKYASGDPRPGDDRFDQYERLFNSRSTDLAFTGIYGPLSPANLIAPGVRVEAQPSARLQLRAGWKGAWLAEPADVWVGTGVRDPSGRSGRFVGHALEGRARYWLAPGRVRADLGLAALVGGRFQASAPNAGEGETLYGYAQLTTLF